MVSTLFPAIDVALIFGGWLALWVVFLRRRRAPVVAERKRDRAYVLGVVLQGVGLALVWGLRRAVSSATTGWAVLIQALVTISIGGLVTASVWLTASAVRALGKQWSIAARVVEGHELITDGPYRIVRHPIYAGMLGLLVATGLGLSAWPALVGGALLFVSGTWVRITAEERLLRGIFGTTYEQYACEVPALIPARLPARYRR